MSRGKGRGGVATLYHLPAALRLQVARMAKRSKPLPGDGRRAKTRRKAEIEMIRRGTQPDARMIAAEYRASRE